MVLKSTKVVVNDIEFTVKELSMAAHLRLEELEKKTSKDIYKECIVEWQQLEGLAEQLSAKDFKLLAEAVNALNEWK